MKEKRRSYYVKYLLAFLFCFLFVYSYFYFTGRTFIKSGGDGEYQHYKALVFYSRYLKDIFGTLIHEHRLVIPQYSFTLGEGADILQTLHSDVYGDPIAFLSVLIPENYIYLYYEFSIALRIFLSGLFFSLLCFYTGVKNENGVLAGAVVYDFCYWSLFALRQHIYFLTPLMYLPLLILGVEHVIRKDKTWIMTLAVFLGAVSQFYFFYIEAVLVALYSLVRLICKYKNQIREIASALIRIFLYALLGLCMAMVIVAPMAYAYVSDSRMGVDNPIPLLYTPFYYTRLFTIFVSNDFAYDLLMGFASPCLLATSLSLKNIRKKPIFLILNVFALMFLVFPVFGWVLNGFAYVTQRWSFALALLFAYQLSYFWEDMQSEKKYLFIFLCLFLLVSVSNPWSRNMWVYIPMLICVLFYVCSCFDLKSNGWKKIKEALLVVLIAVNVLYIADYDLSSRGKERIKSAMTIDYAQKLLSSTDSYAFREYIDNYSAEEFPRYSGKLLEKNSAMLYDVYSTEFYWSITNSSVMNYRKDLALNDRISWQIWGYDDRAPLLLLANANYYLCEEWYDGIIPYGYEYETTLDGYKIFRSSTPLSFGYTYSNALSRDEWMKLNPLEKQNAMLQMIVLDNPDTESAIGETALCPVQNIALNDGIVSEENALLVTEDDSSLTIDFESEDNCEVYLMVRGLQFDDVYGLIENDQTDVTLKVSIDENTKTIGYFSKEHRYYYDKGDFLIYMGESSLENQVIDIEFDYSGRYSFDEMAVYLNPVGDYENWLSKLSDDHLTDIKVETNSLCGKIEAGKEEYLLLSIPYSKSWSAYVDGQKQEILEANECYMALKLEKGSHSIELKYETPLLKYGAAVSAVSILVFAVLLVRDKRKKSCM